MFDLNSTFHIWCRTSDTVMWSRLKQAPNIRCMGSYFIGGREISKQFVTNHRDAFRPFINQLKLIDHFFYVRNLKSVYQELLNLGISAIQYDDEFIED